MTSSTNETSRWAALALIVTAQFMVILDVAIVNVALPSIKSDLGLLADEPAVGRSPPTRSSSAARCCSAGGSPTCSAGGACSSAGLALFSVSSLLCGLAWSEASLIALPRRPGPRRRAARPRRALAADDDLRRGPRAQLALGIYGGGLGERRRCGRAARRRAHLVPELVVDLLHQRPGRPRRDRAHAACSCARAAPTSRTATSTSPGAASVTAGLMLLVYATTRATSDGWGAPTTLGALRRRRGARSSRSS